MENLLSKVNKQAVDAWSDNTNNFNSEIFKYISISTSSILNVFISVVFSDEIQNSKMFDWGPSFKRNLIKLNNSNVKKANKYLCMDFLAYMEDTKPIEFLNNTFGSFELFKKDFLTSLNFNKYEIKKFNQNLTKYKTGFNSDLILNTLNFPKKSDDDYLLNILDDLKDNHFEIMFNSTINLYNQLEKEEV